MSDPHPQPLDLPSSLAEDLSIPSSVSEMTPQQIQDLHEFFKNDLSSSSTHPISMAGGANIDLVPYDLFPGMSVDVDVDVDSAEQVQFDPEFAQFVNYECGSGGGGGGNVVGGMEEPKELGGGHGDEGQGQGQDVMIVDQAQVQAQARQVQGNEKGKKMKVVEKTGIVSSIESAQLGTKASNHSRQMMPQQHHQREVINLSAYPPVQYHSPQAHPQASLHQRFPTPKAQFIGSPTLSHLTNTTHSPSRRRSLSTPPEVTFTRRTAHQNQPSKSISRISSPVVQHAQPMHISQPGQPIHHSQHHGRPPLQFANPFLQKGKRPTPRSTPESQQQSKVMKRHHTASQMGLDRLVTLERVRQRVLLMSHVLEDVKREVLSMDMDENVNASRAAARSANYCIRQMNEPILRIEPLKGCTVALPVYGQDIHVLGRGEMEALLRAYDLHFMPGMFTHQMKMLYMEFLGLNEAMMHQVLDG